jgi:hypothetical protein
MCGIGWTRKEIIINIWLNRDDNDQVLSQEKFIQPPYRCEAPIGWYARDKEELGLFLQISNILRKKGNVNLKIGGIR